MPNWCSNDLVITGTEEQIQGVKEHLDIVDGYWDFNKIFPCPPQLLNSKAPASKDAAVVHTEKYGAPDWWHWCNGNWGTKWSVNIEVDDLVDFEGGSRWFLAFDSAWSPPVGVLKKLFEKFPKVNFFLKFRL